MLWIESANFFLRQDLSLQRWRYLYQHCPFI
jgi:hypothetical protein